RVPHRRLSMNRGVSPVDEMTFATTYLRHVVDVLQRVRPQDIVALMQTLVAARDRGARIFFIGNGNRSWTKPFKAVSLTDNVPVLTAIANDYGYDEIFRLQLKTQMSAGDVVVAISASGNSPNVLKAVEWA